MLLRFRFWSVTRYLSPMCAAPDLTFTIITVVNSNNLYVYSYVWFSPPFHVKYYLRLVIWGHLKRARIRVYYCHFVANIVKKEARWWTDCNIIIYFAHSGRNSFRLWIICYRIQQCRGIIYLGMVYAPSPMTGFRAADSFDSRFHVEQRVFFLLCI